MVPGTQSSRAWYCARAPAFCTDSVALRCAAARPQHAPVKPGPSAARSLRTTTDRAYAGLWQSCKGLFTWWVNSLMAHSSFTNSHALGKTKQLVLERDELQVTETSKAHDTPEITPEITPSFTAAA